MMKNRTKKTDALSCPREGCGDIVNDHFAIRNDRFSFASVIEWEIML